MYFLSKELFFPDVSQADPQGILAIGGDLSPERMELAYKSGVFPWGEVEETIIWWPPNSRMLGLVLIKIIRKISNKKNFKFTFNKKFSEVIYNLQNIKLKSLIIWHSPNPRMVLFLDEFVVSKTMRNILNRNVFEVTFNQNFREVISNCQKIKRDGQNGTWITNDMIESYCKLNEMGIAKSVEVWQNEELVGGLYGIDLGHIFSVESMFYKVSHASKVAFIALVNQLREANYKVLDCQVYTEHLESLGCREIDREDFIRILKPTID
jgi:leucyl/phenylalanyl-tRNA--protein transferase